MCIPLLNSNMCIQAITIGTCRDRGRDLVGLLTRSELHTNYPGLQEQGHWDPFLLKYVAWCRDAGAAGRERELPAGPGCSMAVMVWAPNPT